MSLVDAESFYDHEVENLPSFKTIGHQQVTIIAGTGETSQSFSTHKDLLLRASPYFTAAFTKDRWKEGHSNTIELADFGPDVLAAFLDWLYFGRAPGLWPRLKTRCACHDCTKLPLGQHEEIHFKELTQEVVDAIESQFSTRSMAVNLYIFADKYDVPKLRKDIVDQAWSLINDNFHCDTLCWYAILWACHKLPSHTSFYVLVSNLFIARFAPDHVRCSNIRTLCRLMPSELWATAFAARSGWFSRGTSKIRPHLGAVCAFHEHDETEDSVRKCRLRQRSRSVLSREQSKLAHFIRVSADTTVPQSTLARFPVPLTDIDLHGLSAAAS